MPTIHRLEANSPKHGGVLVTFDDGTAKQAAWSSSTHLDIKGTARRIVEQLIQALLDSNRQDLLDSTNWVSMVAGVAKHVSDWNDTLVAAETSRIVGSVRPGSVH
jgi:hypothetical protein